jgi:hypothetical protein
MKAVEKVVEGLIEFASFAWCANLINVLITVFFQLRLYFSEYSITFRYLPSD